MTASLIDTPLVRRNNVMRKSLAYAYRAPRALRRLTVSADDYKNDPPVVVNSVPKSGTHLLLQIARALPGTHYYGSFIAQMPSVSMRYRSQKEIDAHIRAIIPGEVLGAHLHYSGDTTAALANVNALHLFIYRDPRDIVLSEAHYLANMNRWHRLHSRFRKIKDMNRQVELAINGIGDPIYPNVAARLAPYAGWLEETSIVTTRYEHLTSLARRDDELRGIARAYSSMTGKPVATLGSLVAAILPERSHTFRSGGIGGWRREMSRKNQERMELLMKRCDALRTFAFEDDAP